MKVSDITAKDLHNWLGNAGLGGAGTIALIGVGGLFIPEIAAGAAIVVGGLSAFCLLTAAAQEGLDIYRLYKGEDGALTDLGGDIVGFFGGMGVLKLAPRMFFTPGVNWAGGVVGFFTGLPWTNLLPQVPQNGNFGSAATVFDPIVLDLSGNGITTTNLSSDTTFFDYNNNGFSDFSGWITPGEGILVTYTQQRQHHRSKSSYSSILSRFRHKW